MGMLPYYLYRQHYMLGNLANIGYAASGSASLYNIQMMEERHVVLGIGPASATKVPQADGHHLKKLNMPKDIGTYTGNLPQLAHKRSLLLRMRRNRCVDHSTERHERYPAARCGSMALSGTHYA